MLFDSHIEAAEARLEMSRARASRRRRALGEAVKARLRSPQAHLAAGAAGFAWGMRPVETRGRTRARSALRTAAGLAWRALLTRWLTEVVA